MSDVAWKVLAEAIRNMDPKKIHDILNGHSGMDERFEMAEEVTRHNEGDRSKPPEPWDEVVRHADEVMMEFERATVLGVARRARDDDADDPWGYVGSELMQAVDALEEMGLIFQRPELKGFGVKLNPGWVE